MDIKEQLKSKSLSELFMLIRNGSGAMALSASEEIERRLSAQHTLAGGLCPVCRGSKVVFDGVLRQCRKCNGTGKAAKA